MATAKEHYDTVLSDIYSWMLGGFDAGIQKNSDFFQSHMCTMGTFCPADSCLITTAVTRCRAKKK